MWWIISVICVIFIVLIYLMFAPIYVEIDSNIGLYMIRFHRLASVKLLNKNNSLILEINMAGWKKQIDIISEKKQKIKQIKNKEKKQSQTVSFNKIKAMLKTFRIYKFRVLIDTGNMQLNGILFPLFYFISRIIKKNFQINFLNNNEIVLKMENNFARIMWAFIRS